MKKIKLTISQVRKLETEGWLHNVLIVDTAERINIQLERPTTVATGMEIHEFFDNGWDMDYYHEDDTAEIQLQDQLGNWLLEDLKTYDLSTLGYVVWQGKHTPEGAGKAGGMTFEEAFLKWRSRK
jgi:hypothetical protein